METGFVKFYNSWRGYGFISVDGGGEDIFFHFNNGQNFEAGRNIPAFCGGPTKREPKVGDCVIFERSSSSKGPKADPWGFLNSYNQAKHEIMIRPAPVMYRVLKQTTVSNNPPDEPNVLWEGSDIAELSEKYRRPSDPRMDDLYPTFSCGDFYHTIWFEKMTENGWEHTSDPRPVEYGRRRW